MNKRRCVCIYLYSYAHVAIPHTFQNPGAAIEHSFGFDDWNRIFQPQTGQPCVISYEV